MMFKIGDKVRHIHSETEGTVVGFTYNPLLKVEVALVRVESGEFWLKMQFVAGRPMMFAKESLELVSE